jgi:hypothetical protein
MPNPDPPKGLSDAAKGMTRTERLIRIAALADNDHVCEGCENDQACELGELLDQEFYLFRPNPRAKGRREGND